MPVDARGRLHVFVLNVGQADASVVVTPANEVVVIDAVKPDKLTRLLGDLGLAPGGTIAELVITHPHRDHYSAAQRLLSEYGISAVALAPFWYYAGARAYQALVALIDQKDIPVRFVSGYERIYPDGIAAPGGEEPAYVELLGPSNRIMADLDGAGELNPNHLSIISRITWGAFSMVSAADAQMENWAHFDREGMLAGPCAVLKAAHHGSCRGTQFERLERLSPRLVIVSSDPDGTHDLPDLVGSATFLESSAKRVVALTKYTGTIRLSADSDGSLDAHFFGDDPYDRVDLAQATPLSRASNPSGWAALTNRRAEEATT